MKDHFALLWEAKDRVRQAYFYARQAQPSHVTKEQAADKYESAIKECGEAIALINQAMVELALVRGQL